MIDLDTRPTKPLFDISAQTGRQVPISTRTERSQTPRTNANPILSTGKDNHPWWSVTLGHMVIICVLHSWELFSDFIGFSVQLHILNGTNAPWGYPLVKWEIENLSQITTTAPIFLQFNYFRQKYLEIASCTVSLLNNIWVRVEHSLMPKKDWR